PPGARSASGGEKPLSSTASRGRNAPGASRPARASMFHAVGALIVFNADTANALTPGASVVLRVRIVAPGATQSRLTSKPSLRAHAAAPSVARPGASDTRCSP